MHTLPIPVRFTSPVIRWMLNLPPKEEPQILVAQTPLEHTGTKLQGVFSMPRDVLAKVLEC